MYGNWAFYWRKIREYNAAWPWSATNYGTRPVIYQRFRNGLEASNCWIVDEHWGCYRLWSTELECYITVLFPSGLFYWRFSSSRFTPSVLTKFCRVTGSRGLSDPAFHILLLLARLSSSKFQHGITSHRSMNKLVWDQIPSSFAFWFN